MIHDTNHRYYPTIVVCSHKKYSIPTLPDAAEEREPPAFAEGSDVPCLSLGKVCRAYYLLAFQPAVSQEPQLKLPNLAILRHWACISFLIPHG